MRSVAWVAAAVVGCAALAGCEASPRPAAPPGSEAALGTGAATLEESAVTTDAAEAAAEASAAAILGLEEGTAAAEDAVATGGATGGETTTDPDATDAGSAGARTTDVRTDDAAADPELPVDEPPRMPEVALEQSEAGAQAFAEHYLDALNWAFQTRYVPYAASLRTTDCWTCAGLEDAARAIGRQEGFVRILDASASIEGTTASVSASVERLPEGQTPVEMTLTLAWDGLWLVQEVKFAE